MTDTSSLGRFPANRPSASVRLALWLVEWRPLADAETIRRSVPAHLEYLLQLEDRGILFGSGPLIEADGADTGAGLTLLRVARAEEAAALADADPLVTAGLRTYSVRRWVLVEGEIELRVRFSDGSASLR